MPISNVSTYQVFQNTLADVSKVENDLTKEQQQLSSGNASQDFAEMGGQTEQFLSLDTSINKSNTYITNNTVVQTRVNATNTALDQIISTATSLQSLISQRISGVSNNAAFNTQVQGMWQTLVSQLNTNVQGAYVFSGTRTDVQAVNDTQFPVLAQAGVPDDGYYQGSDQDMTLRAADNISITYNVRANNPAFQKLFAGLSTAVAGDASNDTEQLKQAYDFVNQGLKEVIAVQATVNSNKVAIDNVNANHQTFIQYWKGVKESIGNTDIVSVSTQVAINQGILQAAFQAFAKINSLRLSDFLR